MPLCLLPGNVMMLIVGYQGLITGVLYARIISGVIAQNSTWRVVYAVAAAQEGIVLILLYAFLPDIPAKPRTADSPKNYPAMLWSTARLVIHEPVMLQTFFLTVLSSYVSTAYWNNLTFILSSNPYGFSTDKISLMSLAGAGGALSSPLAGLLADKLLPYVLFHGMNGT